MGLLDDIKVACRVSGSAFDGELTDLIEAAVQDMRRVGVPECALTSPSGIAKQAIVCRCKAGFGYDNPERYQFEESYRRCVVDLMHSIPFDGGEE